MKKYKLAVFIGRFQPIHKGHLSVIRKALSMADNLLMILGSSNQARSIKNPWTYPERIKMIQDSLFPEESKNIYFSASQDWFYNEARWLTEIQESVYSFCPSNKDIVLVGHIKDDSSYYLKSFPQWDFHECGDYELLNATDIRNKYFQSQLYYSEYMENNISKEKLSNEVCKSLFNFSKRKEYIDLVKEYEFIQDYKQSWANSPYPPIFVTVDSVVVQSGHVLVIERGGFPGKGLLALPGGFLDVDEQIEPAVIRELREETGLKVPAPVLLGSVKDIKVFDHPGRSQRGRTITHAYYIKLKDDKELPRVKGSSDATKAFWMPFSDVTHKRHEFYEDHYQILNAFLNI